MFGWILAEVPEQNRPAAGRRLDQCCKRVEPLAFALPALRLDFGLDAATGKREILRRPEQPCLRRISIAAGAASLLVISLDRLGDSRVGDEADVGLVDSHSEGRSRR